jgi:hypothetical protein
LPVLDAAVEKARTTISTETLLVVDEDRRFEGHRARSELGAAARDLAKVRAVAQPAASGSFERAPQVELRGVSAKHGSVLHTPRAHAGIGPWV